MHLVAPHLGHASVAVREMACNVLANSEEEAMPTPATHAILRLLEAGECIRHSI